LIMQKSKREIVISNIVLIGMVSLFIDMSTEMVYPIIPLFLTATLGASPAIVGIIEGIAESIASLLKVFSGYIGDKYHNKKVLTFIGYLASVVYKILLLLAKFMGRRLNSENNRSHRKRDSHCTAGCTCCAVQRQRQAGWFFWTTQNA